MNDARTPGPWHVEEDSIICRPDGLDIGQMENPSDAVLAAAAPGLLAACKMARNELASALGCLSDDPEAIEGYTVSIHACDTALAKAETVNGEPFQKER